MRTVIVGGGASGASCAARLRRLDENAEIIILEATDEISIANCGLPYFCSNVISDRDKMIVAKPTVFSDTLNVEVRFNSRVTRINRETKSVVVNNDYELNYDKLVLALGANPIKPPIPGIESSNIFSVRTLNDADRIKAYISEHESKNAVVVGGGFIGVEMAENFVELGLNTTLIELSDQILAPVDSEIAAFAQNEMRNHGCKLVLNDGVKSFENSQVELISGENIPYDIAILAIGVKPQTEIAKECGLELGVAGSIKVNEQMQTSDENIYAAGDSVQVVDFVTEASALIPLAGPANRQGRIIADNIVGKQSKYKKSQGTAVVKVFDKTVASVGKNEKQLIKDGISYLKNIIWVNSHAGYYPDATPIILKLLFTDGGRILGAQAVGSEGVDKRIDVISTIMRLNGSVEDLIDSELCYAPPYSSAKDPVNVMGMSASNILDGLVKMAFYEDLKDAYLIDVRVSESYNIKTIEGAVSIPVHEIRSRYNEIPRDKKVILFCQRGFNSYIANRILLQLGFDNVYSLAGGKFFYDEVVRDKQEFVLNLNNNVISASKDDSTIKIDACGLQCPGPVLKLADAVKTMSEGQKLEIATTDMGFAQDIKGWCNTTKNTLINIEALNGKIVATIMKGQQQADKPTQCCEDKNGQTIVVFSDDLDKAMAAMIIANGAKASGKDVTLFFTFWGINILRKSSAKSKNKSLIEKMFGFMMPKGANKLKLSKMNMGGMGSKMMKMVMKHKNVPTLNELLETAMANGVKIIACTMAMDIMGIKKEELIDGIDFGGVAKYISESNEANSNLFI